MRENIFLLTGAVDKKISGRRARGLLDPHLWRDVGLVFGFYTFLTILYLPQIYLMELEPDGPFKWYVYVWRIACSNYLWAFLTPFVFYLGNRFPLESPKLVRGIVLHLIFSLVFGAFHTIAWHYLYLPSVGTPISQIPSLIFGKWAFFIANVTNGFIFYAGILTFNQAVNYSRKFRDREFRLQQAELEALKTQLHPHFLFNTLNAVSALVYVSPPEATKTIAQLSDLLRLTLGNDKAQEVPLKDELDFLRKYLQIQQTLLQERLEIHWKTEPETLDALVPNMLLQPLIENSIRHGIAPKEDGGSIEICSRRFGNSLILEIKDTGLGARAKATTRGDGIGLGNTAARLKHLYGDAQKFASGALPESGWRVTIEIPLTEQTEK